MRFRSTIQDIRDSWRSRRDRHLPVNSGEEYAASQPVSPPDNPNTVQAPVPDGQLGASGLSLDSIQSPSQAVEKDPWNAAYDALKKENAGLVDSYERLLTCQLNGNTPDEATSSTVENMIEQEDRGKRQSQMSQLINDGLQKIDKEVKAKQAIQHILGPFSGLKSVIDETVKVSPEASLIWGGISCVFQVLTNPVTETQQSREGLTYVLSRMKWYDALSKHVFDGPQTAKRVELEARFVMFYQRLLSYQMNSVCSYYKRRAVVFLRDLVLLDNWADALADVKEEEEELRKDIGTFTNDEIESHLKDLAASAGNLQGTLSSTLRDALQEHRVALQEMRLDDKISECMNRLLSAYPRIRDPWEDMIRIERQKGGLMLECLSWIFHHPGVHGLLHTTTPRLLCIKGGPGKGKTMMVIGLIKHIKELSDGGAIAVYFCEAVSGQNGFVAILRGLIYSLLKQRPCLIEHVRRRYDTDNAIFEDDNLNAPYTLQGILDDMLLDPSLARTYIVLDALDECEKEQERLLEFITLTANTIPNVRWILSSRNSPDLEHGLNKGDLELQHHLDLSKHAEQEVARAVQAYIKYNIHHTLEWESDEPHSKGDEADSDNDHELKIRIEKIMTERAEGTFLWAHLVFEELRKEESDEYLEALTRMPTGLPGIYERIFARIESQREGHAESCWKILSTAALSYRSLTKPEMAAISGLPYGTKEKRKFEKTLERCSSFLRFNGTSIHFVHLSAREYLTASANQRVFSTIFPHGLSEGHRSLTSRCIEAMSGENGLRQNIYELHTLGPLPGGIPPPNPDPLAALRYPCVFWVNHLCAAFVSGECSHKLTKDMEMVHEFLKTKFLCWFEAIVLMRSISDGFAALEKMKQLFKDLSLESDLVGFVDSIQRLVQKFGYMVNDAPLQLYIAARLFTPNQSLAHTIFSNHELPRWLHTESVAKGDWSPMIRIIRPQFKKEWIRALALSQDSKLLACGTTEGIIYTYDAVTGVLLHQTDAYSRGRVSCLAFSHNSTLLVSGHDSAGDNAVLKIWETADGSEKKEISLEGILQKLAFSHDSRLFATTTICPGIIKVWKTNGWTLERTLDGSMAVFSTRENLLALARCSEQEITFHIFKTDSWEQVKELPGPFGAPHAVISSMAFLNDLDILAAWQKDRLARELRVWNTADESCMNLEDKVHGNGTCFSLDSGRILAYASIGDRVMLWNTVSRSVVQSLEGHTHRIAALSFSDSPILASACRDGNIILWDTSLASPTPIRNDTDWMYTDHIICSPDMSQWVTQSCRDALQVYDSSNMDSKICLSDLPVQSAIFSPDSTLFAATTRDGYLHIYNTERWSLELKIKAAPGGSRGPAWIPAFSADSTVIATAGGEVFFSKVWDVKTGALKYFIPKAGYSASFSPNGKAMAILDDLELFVYNIEEQRETGSVEFSISSRNIVGALPHMSGCVAVSGDIGGYLHDPNSNFSHIQIRRLGGLWYDEPIEQFKVSGKVRTMAFSSDDTHIATNVGRFKVDLTGSSYVKSKYDPDRIALSIGYHFSQHFDWVEFGDEKVLWIPPEYRLRSTRVYAISQTTDHVFFILVGERAIFTLKFAAGGPYSSENYLGLRGPGEGKLD